MQFFIDKVHHYDIDVKLYWDISNITRGTKAMSRSIWRQWTSLNASMKYNSGPAGVCNFTTHTQVVTNNPKSCSVLFTQTVQ